MLSLPQETELLSAFADTPISSRPRCDCLLPYFNKLFRMQKKRFCIKPDAAERYSPYICFRTLYRKKVLIIGIHPKSQQTYGGAFYIRRPYTATFSSDFLCIVLVRLFKLQFSLYQPPKNINIIEKRSLPFGDLLRKTLRVIFCVLFWYVYLNCSFRFINRLPTHNSVGFKRKAFMI